MSGYQGRGGGGGRGRGDGNFRGGDRGRGGGGRGGGDRGGGDRGNRGGGGGGFRPPPDNTVRVFKDPNVPYAAPEAAIANIENTYIKNAGGIGALKISGGVNFPARPGHGTLGRKIAVYANYLKVTAQPKLQLTRYNVEITPEVNGKKLARVFQLLRELPEFTRTATEWKSMILAREPLNIPDPYEVQIIYRAEGQDEPLERAITYKVRVITPTTLAVGDFVTYLCGTNPGPDFTEKLPVIQGLNALFGHSPQARDGIVSIGQNRHFATDHSPQNARNVHVLGGGLESLRGYYQSLRPATGGLLLNVNVTHGVFLEPIALSLLLPKLGSGNKQTLQKKLKMVRVEVTHLPAKISKKTGQKVPKVKTIWGLAHPQDGAGQHRPQVPMQGATAKQVKFWLDAVPPAAATAGGKAPAKKPAAGALPSNTYISVFDYFKKKYPNISLNGDLSVINVGNRENPNYLPVEVCIVMPGQTIKRRLSPDQTQQMITFACRKPWENGESIVGDGKAVLGLNQNSVAPLGHFGLQVGASLITVNARVLQAPQIMYKNAQNKPSPVVPRFGSWNMANIKFHTGSDLGLWTYILFKSNRGRNPDPGYVHSTIGNFTSFLNSSGINATKFIKTQPPPVIELYDGEEGRNDGLIRDIFRSMHQAAPTTKPRFVLCVLPFADVAIYNSIKSVADTKAGMHTVCVVAQKFLKEQRQDQYFGNISLKFNLKAGGINQTLDPTKMGVVGEGKTMVVGIDVTHPSPGSKEGAPSAAAIVASVDKFLGQWPCAFAVQEGKKEMVEGLEGLFMSRLDVWQRKNKTLPENILIYRDGVSEGQYQLLLDQELPLIRAACRQKYPATATKQGLPRLSIIVCGKRHHTRFYPATEGEADRSSNCGPGTVVDRGVTEVRGWDFFLQPHACLQGTARSCHYYVVLDEVFRSRQLKPPHQNHADALEELTNNMCHLFGRATKAVSLCPPAYYADLLCTRLRCYLADQFDPNDSLATGSVVSGTSAQSTVSTPIIPEHMRDSMFYV